MGPSPNSFSAEKESIKLQQLQLYCFVSFQFLNKRPNQTDVLSHKIFPEIKKPKVIPLIDWIFQFSFSAFFILFLSSYNSKMLTISANHMHLLTPITRAFDIVHVMLNLFWGKICKTPIKLTTKNKMKTTDVSLQYNLPTYHKDYK